MSIIRAYTSAVKKAYVGAVIPGYGGLIYITEFANECPAISPTLGNELITNGSIENTNLWWIAAGNVLTKVEDERPGGEGTYSLDVARPTGGGANSNCYQGVTTEFGKWYRFSHWSKNVNASGGVKVWVSNIFDEASVRISTEWTEFVGTSRKTINAASYVRIGWYANTDAQSVRADDLSLKEIIFSSMLSYIASATSKDGVWYCNPVVADETQAGMLLNYQDANNFLMAYVTRRITLTGKYDKAKLLKCVNGVYTEVIDDKITYVSGGELRVFADGNNYSLFYNGISVGATTSITDNVFGYDVYGFNTYEGNQVGTVVKIKQTVKVFPQLTNVTISSTNRFVIGVINGVLYGCSSTPGILYKSMDNGETWGTLQDTGTADTIRGLYLLADGEVLLVNNESIYKSSGWGTNPITATWVHKLTVSVGAWFLTWGVSVVGNKVLLAEYGLPHTVSKHLYLSTDNGGSFNISIDLDTLYPDRTPNYHFHAAEIDHISGRLWVSMGDDLHIIRYSDDDGQTWQTHSASRQPTTIKSAKYGIVCGTDDVPSGVFTISRADNKMFYMVAEAQWSTFGFARMAARSDSEIVYTVFGMANNGKKAPIYASDGRFANIVYELPVNIASVIVNVFINGNTLIANISNGEPYYTLRATL